MNAATATGPVRHVTVVTQRAGRRINDSRGARITLCGAPVTSLDMLTHDARKCVSDPRWNLCPACVERMG